MRTSHPWNPLCLVMSNWLPGALRSLRFSSLSILVQCELSSALNFPTSPFAHEPTRRMATMLQQCDHELHLKRLCDTYALTPLENSVEIRPKPPTCGDFTNGTCAATRERPRPGIPGEGKKGLKCDTEFKGMGGWGGGTHARGCQC